MTLDYFRTFARYNQWANRRLYAACAQLPDEEYRKARPAFFKSILGALNHLLVGDRIWLGRIDGRDSGITALNQILYVVFSELCRAREAEDERLISIVDGLTEQRVASTLAYRQIVSPGGEQRTPMRFVLGHLFNHQTHHRGQVHDLLTQTAVPPPPLDLILYLREAGK
ncbi:MAG: damage-inducible protein DinB [Alphaproteobacteria bacterium]|nr:damage-inducible protein DinB [Alphaproteobacteria bacterium]